MKNTIMPGYLPDGRNNALVPVHITVEFCGGRLSICGVVGAKSNGDCHGSAGQCRNELLRGDFTCANGWTIDEVQKLYRLWERWHLNDIRPECEHQRALGWRELAKKKLDNGERAGHTYYDEYKGAAYASKHPEGILCKPCPVCGYEYGSKWLKEDVPADVIDWLFHRPKAGKACAWGEA